MAAAAASTLFKPPFNMAAVGIHVKLSVAHGGNSAPY